MSTSCRDFRSLLELVLEGGLVPAERKTGEIGEALSELAWHEHLLACGACRNLLEAEEALEILLATLPEPKLPEHLARRVVLRLRDARRVESRHVESRLDALLELDRSARAPHDLGQALLERLRPARERDLETHLAAAEAELDRLLDRDRIIPIPNGLATRVLASLQPERGLLPLRRTSWLRSPWLYAAAAGVLATLIGWAVWQRTETGGRGGVNQFAQPDRTGSPAEGGSVREGRRASENKIASTAGDKTASTVGDKNVGPARDELVQRGANDPPEAALLAALDVLEQWDLLKSDDVDVFLSSAIGPADEALLEFQDTDSANQPHSDKEPEPRSKG